MVAALSTAELQSLARRQWEDYRRGVPGTYFAEEGAPLSLREAYAIQMEVARLRCEAGDVVAGYKVGCIGPGVVEQFGMSGPIHARLFRSEIRNSGETLQYRAYANLAIEGEMAVRIGRNAEIEAVFPVIELHHFVFRGDRKTLAELVANNGINGGAVIPSGHADMTLGHWANVQSLSVEINGVTVEAGQLWAMSGGASAAVEWLRQSLASFGLSLNPGDIVLAGTPLGLTPVKIGDHIEVSVDGRKYVECRIA